ncbi:hypothetical protein AB1Y20_013336 [Prymnesium parvum]|uniref:PDZ domain-containing protein n=1 Tax=Prymnesium parvum TaxID=97485 RepID=A0AB34IKB3_PRYPA
MPRLPRLAAGWLALCALLPAASAQTQTIVTEHSCGDLPACVYTNDGTCDDGGPGASYAECPRFSDATDCRTLCAHGVSPPPPPSCTVAQWAESASASSAFSRLFSAAEATGPPTHHLQCAAALAGSWSPLTKSAAPNWLEVRFAERVFVHSLRVSEHANPKEMAGFVRSVSLQTEEGWVDEAWRLAEGEDSTPCGGVLSLYAIDSAVAGLSSKRVNAARIYTQTRADAWEYIDAVQLIGSRCENGTFVYYPRLPPASPSAPPLPPPASPAPRLPPKPSPPAPTRPAAASSSTDGAVVALLLTAVIGMAVLSCLAMYSIIVCQRARSRHREVTVVAAEPFQFEMPAPPSAASAASAAAQAELRARCTRGDMNVLLARLYKPQQATALGINLCADVDDTDVTVISSLIPGSIADLSGVLCTGDKILSVNGCKATNVPMAANMLRQAEGAIMIELLRSRTRQSVRAPLVVNNAQRQRMESCTPSSPAAPCAPDGGEVASEPPAAAEEQRPWTPRTHEMAHAEMKQAIDDGDIARLASVANRMEAESARLRQEGCPSPSSFICSTTSTSSTIHQHHYILDQHHRLCLSLPTALKTT